MARKNKPTAAATFTISPGQYLVIETSSASGGVHYARQHGEQTEINDGTGYEQEISSTKHVDHKDLVAEADAFVQSSRYLLRCHASNTTLGWICVGDDINKLLVAAEELRVKAVAFNQRAALARCGRRVRIGIVPIRLEVDNATAAAEIARTVREVCQDFIDAFRAGDVGRLNGIFIRAKNLEKLATGMQRDSVIFALECAKTARTAIKAAKRKGEDLAAVGADLDLESLEGCVAMFGEMSTLELVGGLDEEAA